MSDQTSEFLKWAAEMRRVGSRKIAELLRLAAAIEGERDELLGGKILNQLVVHRLKTKLAALTALFQEVWDNHPSVFGAKASSHYRSEIMERFAAAKETPQ